MPTRFREYNDDAAMLLPLAMREWLPEDHLAYLIRDLVHSLDLAPFYRPYAGDGRRNRPYDPTMMVTTKVCQQAEVDPVRHPATRRMAERLAQPDAFGAPL